MSRNETSPRAAIQRWNRLSIARQRAVVRDCAHMLTRNWPDFFDSNVVGLAFGAREKRVPAGKRTRRKSQLLHECPTLIVVVEKKLSKSRLAKRRTAKPIPEHITAVVKVRGRRVPVAIPTDVIQKPRAARAQGVEGLQMRNAEAGLGIRGSVAAIVRDIPDSGERYFLTCHHVACLSLLDPNLEPLLPADATLLPVNSPIGTTEREAFFGQGVGPCIDAALVRIDPDDAADEDLSLPMPITGAVTSFEQLEAERESGMALFSLHKPGGAPVEFQRIHVNLDVTYESGAVATIVEAMEYRLVGPQTRGGDSGGALISANGVFLGMHIAGAGFTGFGIPAYMLLESPAFDPMVALA
jgi:hypothetical protein